MVPAHLSRRLARNGSRPRQTAAESYRTLFPDTSRLTEAGALCAHTAANAPGHDHHRRTAAGYAVLHSGITNHALRSANLEAFHIRPPHRLGIGHERFKTTSARTGSGRCRVAALPEDDRPGKSVVRRHPRCDPDRESRPSARLYAPLGRGCRPGVGTGLQAQPLRMSGSASSDVSILP